jgi:hypothetical protein
MARSGLVDLDAVEIDQVYCHRCFAQRGEDRFPVRTAVQVADPDMMPVDD